MSGQTRSMLTSVRSYLSPAPQALPQAAGFSFGLSAAPQAAGASAGLSPAPQAAGFSDAPHAAGLSDAPHALPAVFSFHPAMFDNAICLYLLTRLVSAGMIASCVSHYKQQRKPYKYAPFYNPGYLFVTIGQNRALELIAQM
nr:hypothetical protein [uncultured Dialister sp.]